jgi:hypothetical protein
MDMKEKSGPVSRWRSDHPLALRSLLAWVVLLPLALWVESLDAAWAVALAQVLSPLAGSFGAVVLGSLFIDRWELDRLRKDRHAWLDRNASLVTDDQQLARALMAQLVVPIYDAVRGFIPEHEAVTDQLLDWDVKTPPASSRDWVSRLSESMRLNVLGPLGWAGDQIAHAADAAYWARHHRTMQQYSAITGRSPTEDELRYDASGVAHLRDKALVAAGAVQAIAPMLATVLRDLGTLDLLRPLREEQLDQRSADDPAPGADLVYHSHRLEVAALALMSAAKSEDTGTGAALPHAEEPSEWTVATLAGLRDVLDAVRAARSALHEQALVVASYAREVDASTLAGLIAAATKDLSETQQARQEAEWDRFVEGTRTPSPRARNRRH